MMPEQNDLISTEAGLGATIDIVRLLKQPKNREESPFENYLIFAAITIGTLIFLTICAFFLQEFCHRRFGLNCCPGSGRVLSRSTRLARIRALQVAMHEQQQTTEALQGNNEEEQQRMIEEKRKERRAKYKGLLKDNTMVVSEKALVQDLPISPTESSSDIETGDSTQIQQDNHLLDTLQLCLPVKDENGQPRRVSGHCAVCIAEYEAGDEVVWSTSDQCPHVFHDECILMWLSKGKKRCPICRNTFVPSNKNATNNTMKSTEDNSEDVESSGHSQNQEPDSEQDGSQDPGNDQLDEIALEEP